MIYDLLLSDGCSFFCCLPCMMHPVVHILAATILTEIGNSCYLLACSGDRFFADVACVWFIFFILSISRLNRILHFR